MRRTRLPALLLLLAAASACTRRASYDDPGQVIRARPGTEFELALRSNQSTGYRWVLVDSAALGPLRPAGSGYRVTAGSGDGAGGVERWTFRAEGTGEGVVTLVYVPPGEGTAPRDTTRFRAIVR
ncbi:MAG: protease inhibitor I42 family protein [Longimicrobiaceae bacterium]